MTYMMRAVESKKICGDGIFTHKCSQRLEEMTQAARVLLTSSCTHALEMSALLADIQPGDDVIMSSYTFVSTANAFVLRGARIVFADIRPDTMNLDEKLIEAAISKNTKAIVPTHYAGVGCEMDLIGDLAQKYGLFVIEDAAQGVMAQYKGKALGAIGDFGCYSFHETKNYSMGEGGALLIQSEKDLERAEIIREKGTDRSRFLRGQTDKYTWIDRGSSYLPSDLNAAFLLAQLECAQRINENRLASYRRYEQGLSDLKNRGKLELPQVPEYCRHNAHMFYVKTKDLQERTDLISFLKERQISAAFHYVPLHSSPAGMRFGVFCGKDIYTTRESERLARLPMYYGLRPQEVDRVLEAVQDFYKDKAMTGKTTDTAVTDTIMTDTAITDTTTTNTVMTDTNTAMADTAAGGVSLRPLTREDTANIVKWRNIPRVRNNFIYQMELTAAAHEKWLETRVKTGQVEQFIIVTEEDGDVGSVYLRDIDRIHRKAEFGIFIGEESALGKGIGTAAARMILDYAFHNLGLNKVFLRVLADNARALSSYERAGFVREGCFVQDVIIDNEPRDLVFMAALCQHSPFCEPSGILKRKLAT